MSLHAEFSQALFRQDGALPSGLRTWNGSDPAQRFAVYRNNVLVSLIDALADSFPVVQMLVDETFFRAMAREFALIHPPRSPVMAEYGAHFPDFIRQFPHAQSLPYLSDLAQLEWRRVEAWHGADAMPMAIADISTFLSDPDRLPLLRARLHPTLAVVESKFPVGALWVAHQLDTPEEIVQAVEQVAWHMPESLLVVRTGLDVHLLPIDSPSAAFVRALQRGMTLGEASTVAVIQAADFDLAPILAVLIRHEALIELSYY